MTISNSPEKVYATNDFLLGAYGSHRGKTISSVMHHPEFTRKQQAFRFAAWLVAMAEILPDEPDQQLITFEQILEAVKRT